MIPVLHYFHQKGCGFCLKGEEFLKDYERKFGGKTVLIVRHRMDLMDYPIDGWVPGMSPAYALVSSGTLLANHEGVLDVKGLVKFVEQKKKKRKVKVGSKQSRDAAEPPEDEDREEDLEDEDEDE